VSRNLACYDTETPIDPKWSWPTYSPGIEATSEPEQGTFDSSE